MSRLVAMGGKVDNYLTSENTKQSTAKHGRTEEWGENIKRRFQFCD